MRKLLFLIITLFKGEQGLQGAPGDDGMRGIKVTGSFVVPK